MPRKKKTKVTSSRAKPKIPDGDEGNDLEADLKQAKLETLLKDFDDTVEQRLTEMNTYAKTMIREIKTFHKVELMKIPKNIAEMKLTDFLAIGGTVNKVKMLEEKQIEDQMEAKVDSKKGQRLTKKAGNGGALEAIAEEGQENIGPAESAKMRTREDKPMVMNPLLKAPLKTRGTMRKNPLAQKNRPAFGYDCLDLKTPAHGKPLMAGWETPLVTPKFDPRLPMTPATMRRKKPGESVKAVHMSLAGSPIAAEKTELTVPLKSGNVLCLAADDDPTSLPLQELDAVTLQELTRLHENISKIVEYHKSQQ